MNEKLEPVNIILVTFNRSVFLEKTIKAIYERTKYPYKLWVIDNASTDETPHLLKKMKLHGFIFDYISLPKNGGEASGLTEGFNYIKKSKGGVSKYIVCTQDDLIPPSLQPCWLERLVHLAEKYPDYGGIALRIQRIRHREVDEQNELIPSSSGLPAVFRISRSEDIELMGNFGSALHWEGVSFSVKMKSIKKPLLAMATHLYCDHIGFMPQNRGFVEGFTNYHTYSPERDKQGEDQPYPDIDPITNIPIKINTPRDDSEQRKREEYQRYWGYDGREDKRCRPHRLTEEQKELSKYCEEGVGLDLGCGGTKCNPNCIGVDIDVQSIAEIKSDVCDLWMFEDNKLDFIVNAHLLEHLPNTIEVLKEWKRVLKPDGILAIAVPDGELKPKYIIKNGHKVNLGLKTLRLLIGNVLNMKIIRLEQVPKSPGKFVALIVAKKIK
jgi:hypothetical protein